MMEYEKIINLLDNTLNQPSKFGTKSSIEINDGTYMERIIPKGKSNLRLQC